MSQIRKFKNGSVFKEQNGGKDTPKPDEQPKKYGHLWVDGIDYGDSEDVYNAFAAHARSQNLNQGEFYDQWLRALRSGEDVVFGNGNTVNVHPEDMTEKRAGKRSNWARFWDDTFDTRRNQFSDAIATARRFTFTPKVEVPKGKAAFDTSKIELDYNDDPKKKGHRVWSTGATENQRAIQRVTDALAGLADPDNSEYTYSDALRGAYGIATNSGMTPDEYAAAVWSRLQDPNWTGYKNAENDNDLDWLRAFGIVVAPYDSPAVNAPAGSGSNGDGNGSIGSGNNSDNTAAGNIGKGNNGSGNQNTGIKPDDNNPPTVPANIDDAIKAATYDPKKVTVITPYDNDPDMLWGMIYDGKKYKSDEITKGSLLWPYVEKLTKTNNKKISQRDRVAELSSDFNMRDISNFNDWKIGQNYDNIDLTTILGNNGIVSAAISDITDLYAPSNGERFFKIYDNFTPGGLHLNNERSEWGIRSPFYLTVDKDGNLLSFSRKNPIDTGHGNILVDDGKMHRPSFSDIVENAGSSIKLMDKSGYPSAVGLSHRNPATLIYTSNDGRMSIYRSRDSEGQTKFYKAKPDGTNAEALTLEQLYSLLKKYNYEKERDMKQGSLFNDGGKINFNKVNTLVAKHGGILKGQNGLRGLDFANSISSQYFHPAYKPSILDEALLNHLNNMNTGVFTVQNTTGLQLDDPFANAHWFGTQVNPFDVKTIEQQNTDNLVSSYNSIFGNPVTKFNNPIQSINSVKVKTPDPIMNKLNVQLNPMEDVELNYFDLTPEEQAEIDTDFQNNLKALQEGLSGDPNMDTSNAWLGLVKGLTGLMDYGSMAWGRHKVHDQIEKRLKDSLYRKTTPRLQGVNTATPIEDAAVMNADKYIRSGLNAYETGSDIAQISANQRAKDELGLKNRENAVRQQSTAAFQRQQANQQIANQQATIDAEAENDFRARLAGLKYNLGQNDASLTAQIAQSQQNLAREWRTKLEDQTSKFNQLAYNQALNTETEAANNRWLQDVRTTSPDIWKKWEAADKSKYNDFYTWATTENGIWNDNLANSYKRLYSDPLTAKTLELYKKYNMSPELQWIYRDRYGVANKKSGGNLTVKKQNRYKNEPAEDIWINQNKATHKLVAKLNDNIIKTFLKTLK